jgi:galactose mutarotase-like enzyme
MVTLENDVLKVEVEAKGAELKSVKNKFTKLEYMWSGDPAFWGKTSPVLFPVIGTLKQDTFLFKERPYALSRHGFARDSVFERTDTKKDSAVFILKSSPTSLLKYPFEFEFEIQYRLVNDFLEVTYHVKNIGEETMYFSVGGHPAFRVPLTDNSTYEDHRLEFDSVEDAPRWPISQEGLIEKTPVPFFKKTSVLSLTRSLFNEDALVFKNLKSTQVSIKSSAHSHGIDFYFKGFPFLGIWAAKNADFVCIEPWCGIADSVSHDQHLESKEGIEKLEAQASWSRTWKVRFY